MALDKAFSESVDNIMNFAEILYKCTLCTSLPSILTSKTSFVSHVKGQHFNQNLTKCSECLLTFETEEDLLIHSKTSHSVVISTSRGSENPTLNRKVKEDEMSSAEESVISQQETDLEKSGNSVNLIENNYRCEKLSHADHSSGESSKSDLANRSAISGERPFLLKNKGQGMPEVMESPQPENRPKVNIEYGLENSMRQHPCVNNLTRIHAVADQILAVNSSRIKPTGNSMIFSPGYTPEFGKFTKLVREGGNIVYFCQVCNWKSQIKSHFQVHCQGKVHKEKLKCAEDQGDEKSSSPNSRKEFQGNEKSSLSRQESPVNLSTDIANHSSKPSSPARLSSDRIKSERQNKRKRSVPISLRNQSSDKDGWHSSDSDSDSLDFSRSRPYHSGRTPKKRYSKESKSSPSSEVNSKLDNSNKSVLQLNSDSESNHLDVKQAQGQHQFPMTLPPKKYPEEDPAKFHYGLFNQIHNQILWNLSNRSLETGRSTPDSHPHPFVDSFSYTGRHSFPSNSPHVSPPRASSLYHEHAKSDSEYMYRCSLCSFGCNKIQEYKTHFESQHEQGSSMSDQGPMYGSEGKELWKVNKIKEHLTGMICLFPKGNVSRDLLLQKISSTAQLSEAVHWGPACNRAVREIFPDTLAQRKGKFKKTYFFGVSFIEQIQEPADELSDPELMQYQPLRDMSQDLEKILEHLHNVVEFSEDGDCSISRDDLLTVLHKRIDEPDVLYWGMQCNRAIRIVFPSVIIKRKGKFKTTVYQGVEFKDEAKTEIRQLPLSLSNRRGRPRKISSEDSGELYQMGMNWTDAIRTGHSETYKMYTNLHIPKLPSSEPPPVTRGWGPSIAYHEADDSHKLNQPLNSTINNETLKMAKQSQLKTELDRTEREDNSLSCDVTLDTHGIQDSPRDSKRNHASLSENEADSEEDVSSKKPPLLSRSDREDGICDENTDEDADDEESIGPGIEDKDIE